MGGTKEIHRMTNEHEHDHAGHAGHGHHEHHDDDHGHEAHDHEGHDHEGHDHIAYPDAVAAFRAEKDEAFRTQDDSPIPHEQRHDFPGLPYFDVDEDLRFEGLELEPYAGTEPVRFSIPTSDGKLRAAERAGVFHFRLGDAEQSLTAYTFAGGGSESVFVPFLDATSGQETYGAGRYLDLWPEEDGTYSLDFNLAYHPSCVYDARFSCPITPAENRLPVRIEAGERLAAEATA
jgi:uncharacterized protein (DUF1684 family)